MYFRDMTPYTYLPGVEGLNVGWLDGNQPYPRGTVDDALFRNLCKLCLKPVNQTRGFHMCNLCIQAPYGLEAQVGGKTLLLGSAEIEVRGSDGRVYRAPDLIVHYIRAHGYLPPEEFLQALSRL